MSFCKLSLLSCFQSFFIALVTARPYPELDQRGLSKKCTLPSCQVSQDAAVLTGTTSNAHGLKWDIPGTSEELEILEFYDPLVSFQFENNVQTDLEEICKYSLKAKESLPANFKEWMHIGQTISLYIWISRPLPQLTFHDVCKITHGIQILTQINADWHKIFSFKLHSKLGPTLTEGTVMQGHIKAVPGKRKQNVQFPVSATSTSATSSHVPRDVAPRSESPHTPDKLAPINSNFTSVNNTFTWRIPGTAWDFEIIRMLKFLPSPDFEEDLLENILEITSYGGEGSWDVPIKRNQWFFAGPYVTDFKIEGMALPAPPLTWENIYDITKAIGTFTRANPDWHRKFIFRIYSKENQVGWGSVRLSEDVSRTTRGKPLSESLSKSTPNPHPVPSIQPLTNLTSRSTLTLDSLIWHYEGTPWTFSINFTTTVIPSLDFNTAIQKIIHDVQAWCDLGFKDDSLIDGSIHPQVIQGVDMFIATTYASRPTMKPTSAGPLTYGDTLEIFRGLDAFYKTQKECRVIDFVILREGEKGGKETSAGNGYVRYNSDSYDASSFS